LNLSITIIIFEAIIMENLTPLDETTSNKNSVTDYVKGMDFFSEFEENEYDSVLQWIKAYRAGAGSTIFAEGNQSPQLCLVAEGEISIFKEISTSEYLKVADIKAGGSIGEMSILDGDPVSASAIASIDSVVFIISGDDFRKLVTENNTLGIKLLWKIGKILSLRLRRTTGLLAEISIAKSDD
jgi:CRP/FNR family transcriptional regulator, cyclic AMP receptor protein